MSTPTKPPAAGSEAAVEQEQVSGRERLGWLARNTKLWLGALILLLLAIVVAAASGAIFTSSSANPENTFTAGNLFQNNLRPHAALLSAEDIVPRDAASGGGTSTHTGHVSRRLRLDACGIPA